MDSAGGYVVSTHQTIGFGMFDACVDVVLLEPPPPPQAASVEASAASASSGRRRFKDCPPVVRDLREERLYRARAAAVSAWKCAISCSLWLMSTPCSTAPESSPRCTPSTSLTSSCPTCWSNARSSSIHGGSTSGPKK